MTWLTDIMLLGMLRGMTQGLFLQKKKTRYCVTLEHDDPAIARSLERSGKPTRRYIFAHSPLRARYLVEQQSPGFHAESVYAERGGR